jgi:hypothetical protein
MFLFCQRADFDDKIQREGSSLRSSITIGMPLFGDPKEREEQAHISVNINQAENEDEDSSSKLQSKF